MEEIHWSFIPHNWTASKFLLVALICTLLTWYLRFLWSRRKLYVCSWKLPGPIALPFIGSALHFVGNPEDILHTIIKMYIEYPSIFRVWVGPRLFYGISDANYYEILLPHCLSKDPMYKHGEPTAGHGLATAPMKTWKKHRKIIMPTFNQKVLDEFVEIFSEQSEVLVKQLEKIAVNKEFDMFSIMAKCTVDMICETAMGVKINNQTTVDTPVSLWIDGILETILIRTSLLWYHIDAIFNMSTISKNYYAYLKSFHDFCGSVVIKKQQKFEEARNLQADTEDESLEGGLRKKVFLDHLIEISKNSFTEQELKDEVATFIITGSDTTASTVSFVFMMLGLHKDLQEKVYEEIMEVVGLNRAVEKDDIPKLKYLESFIKETLRLFPVAAVIAREINEDVDLGDHLVPAGISVVFGILRTHINEKYWPNPYKFDPDRFLPEEVAKRHPCAYLPFSYGPRNCIGMKYAMMIMTVILTTVLRNFKISTPYKSIQEIKLKANVFLRPRDGYRVSLELR